MAAVGMLLLGHSVKSKAFNSGSCIESTDFNLRSFVHGHVIGVLGTWNETKLIPA